MRAALVAARSVDTARLTVGVEEEFLLLDPATMANRPVAPAVLAALPAEVRHLSRREFRHSMIEMVTPVCTGLDELAGHLRRLRTSAADAAHSAGACLAAVGATPISEAGPVTPDPGAPGRTTPDLTPPGRTTPDLTPPGLSAPGLSATGDQAGRGVTDDPRFRAIADHYGPIVDDPAVCGCHVHVGVPDRELAVQVCNHLRPWLPVLQALTVNSPFHDGRDTGHASWRAMQLDRWPTLGPTPWFASAEDFDRTVALLVASGAMLDESLILWHARPSATYPTVEIRVADTCLTTGDAVLLAGLSRALVATAVDRIAAGRAAPPLPDGLVRAAHWNAAHTGLDGTLLDLRQGRARPAWDLVGDLLHTVTPALSRSGDLPLITVELARLRAEGPGASRQRHALTSSGDLRTALSLTAVPHSSLIDR